MPATTVLPLPTSPCKSLCMGSEFPRSVSISLKADFCAPVSSKGKELTNLSTSPPFLILSTSPSLLLLYCFLIIARRSCTRNSSSKTSLLLDFSSKSSESGKCICLIALILSIRPSFSLI